LASATSYSIIETAKANNLSLTGICVISLKSSPITKMVIKFINFCQRKLTLILSPGSEVWAKRGDTTHSASFGDCLIYATVKHSNIKEIVTSDKHFNSFDLKVTHC